LLLSALSAPFVVRNLKEALMPVGAFTFVLHSHLPYCRMAGRWPHGEEWVHEAMAETYIPLLNALTDLHEEGLPVRLTLGLTPILCEQLADPLVKDHFEAYVEERIRAAEVDIPRFQEEGNLHAAYLASFYRDWYSGLLDSFRRRYGRDLLGGFRRLQDAGVIEIITSAATHGYLPLLGTDAAIRGQLMLASPPTAVTSGGHRGPSGSRSVPTAPPTSLPTAPFAPG
jgi:Uncharacterized conserved protein